MRLILETSRYIYSSISSGGRNNEILHSNKNSNYFSHPHLIDKLWWHQAIIWTDVDKLSVYSNDIHLRATSNEMPQPSIAEIMMTSSNGNIFRVTGYFLWSAPWINKPEDGDLRCHRAHYDVIVTIRLKISCLRFHPNVPGANESIHCVLVTTYSIIAYI